MKVNAEERYKALYTPEQQWLAQMLQEWRDAGAPVSDVVNAIDGLIVARLERVMKGGNDRG